MAEYALAVPCSGGFMAQLDRPRTGCTGGSGAGRYCCSTAVARTLPGGRLLGSSGTTQGASNIGSAAEEVFEVVTDVVNQTTSKDFGAGLIEGSPIPQQDQQRQFEQPSWISQNWPWLALGGVVFAGFVAFAVLVVSPEDR